MSPDGGTEASHGCRVHEGDRGFPRIRGRKRQYDWVIARVDPPTEISMVVRVGHRRPLAQSSSGQVLFAFQGDAIRERWLSFLAEANAAFDRKKFVRLANQIRERGYASARSQVVDYSAAVLQHDHALCALTVPFIARRASKVTAEAAVRQLCRAAADISESLKYGVSARS